MSAASRASRRTIVAATRAMALFTLVLGVAYPLAITGVGQATMPAQASGSLRSDATGTVRGSALIGQQYLTPAGTPDPRFFHGRPSHAGDGYDGAASSGSNLGPEHPDLVAAIADRLAAVAEFNGVAESAVPADAVTAPSSGLDPHISVAYALLQADRVATARGVNPAEITRLIASHTAGADLGFLGESRVNVLELNLAIEQLRG